MTALAKLRGARPRRSMTAISAFCRDRTEALGAFLVLRRIERSDKRNHQPFRPHSAAERPNLSPPGKDQSKESVPESVP
jgi:hypothetical protein